MDDRKNKTDLVPMVSISCITYNHAPYIRECLDGFMMQKTNFAFEVLIHDDASTDGTADIIREYEAKYPDIIKPIYQTENQYSKGISPSASFNFPRAKGKYIALCEGDDYWTDPFKLQKQVDFLESHPDYVMCSTCYTEYNQSNGTFGQTLPKISESGNITYTLNDYISYKVWYTQPLTSMFLNKKEVFDNYRNCKHRKDATLFYFILKCGKGMLFKESTGVYRHHEGGIWQGTTYLGQVLSEFYAIRGICEVEISTLSAKYLYNCMFSKGFLGKKFICKYINLYNSLLKIITNKLGWKSGLNLCIKNLNVFVPLKNILRKI